jgi:PIN domain nuclease of toxin-antitoxin system
MTFLLDTCTFLWLSDRTEELSPKARELLVDGSNTLFLSQISSIEIQIKFTKGKLPLRISPEEFVAESLERHGIQSLHLSDRHIWTTGKLPPIHHDPFDRLLVAQAIEESMVILTPDPKIHAYPVRTIW